MSLSGSITALATPFTVDGALDLPGYRRIIERQLAGGTQALVVAGSTGEAAALDDSEFEQLIRCAVEAVRGRALGARLSPVERRRAPPTVIAASAILKDGNGQLPNQTWMKSVT